MSASLTQVLILLSFFTPLFLCQDTCSSDAITNCTFDSGHFCEWEHENWYISPTNQAYLYSGSSRGSIKSRWACPNFERLHCLRISYYVEDITDRFEIVYKQENGPTSKVDLPIGHFRSGRKLISIPRSTLPYQISVEATRFTTLIPGTIRIDSIQYDKHDCTTQPTGVATTEAIPPHSIQTETPLAQPLLTTAPTKKLTSALSQTHTSNGQLSTETTQSPRTSSVESKAPFHPEPTPSHASEISLTVKQQSTTTDTSTPRNKTSRDHENLQTLSFLEVGLIAGITVLIIVTVITIVGAVFVIVLIRRRRKENGKTGSNEHNPNDETLHRKPVSCPESDDTQEESAGSGVDTESDYETCPPADTKAVMRYEDDPTTQSSHTETADESKAEKTANVDDGYERARPHPPSYISIKE